MGLPTTALLDLAESTLAGITNYWPEDAEPLPEIQYVSDGLVVWDCASLIVMVESTFGTLEGDVAAEAYPSQALLGFAMRAAMVGVMLLRCVPDVDNDGNPPAVTEVSAAAAVGLTDSIGMFNALILAQQAGELVGCEQIAFERWTSEGPASGLGGGMLRYRALLL